MAEGQHVGGTLGFMSSLSALVSKHRPSRCIVAWEGGGSTRRRDIYPEYKSRRKPQRLNRFHEGDIPDTVENRDWQLKLLIACLKCVPVKQVYVSDCEADDVIGYMAKYSFRDDPVLVVSSDHDYLQLVNDRVKIWSPTLKSLVDTEWVLERYGVLPQNLCVARCFSGDSSDSLPGLKGVGVRTLVKRFPVLAGQETVSVDELVRLAKGHPSSDKIKAIQAMIDGAEVAKRNWRLMNLDVSNLSGNQVGKLSSSLEVPPPHGNKMELIRTLVKRGIKTFDIDRFYVQMNSTLTSGKMNE